MPIFSSSIFEDPSIMLHPNCQHYCLQSRLRYSFHSSQRRNTPPHMKWLKQIGITYSGMVKSVPDILATDRWRRRATDSSLIAMLRHWLRWQDYLRVPSPNMIWSVDFYPNSLPNESADFSRGYNFPNESMQELHKSMWNLLLWSLYSVRTLKDTILQRSACTIQRYRLKLL